MQIMQKTKRKTKRQKETLLGTHENPLQARARNAHNCV